MTEEYIPRLLKYLESLDFCIADRRIALDLRHQINDPRGADPIYNEGPAEAWGSFIAAKRRLFETFPELREHYKGTIEDKI